MGVLKHDERLVGVKPPLVAAIRTGVSRLTFDCTVAQGLRTDEECYVNFGKGRTMMQCLAGGCPPKYAQPALKKVTWLKRALSSNHRGGKAADVYPLVKGQLADTRIASHLPLFRALYEAVMAAGREAGLHIRYGGDWDEDGSLYEPGEDDAVHFELAA